MGINLKRYATKLFGFHKTFHDHPQAKGIGLYLVKAQVEAMGGKIEVENKVNEGSVFKILF